MGNLPPERLSSAMAFLTTGVDYAGPFYVTSARLRGAVSTKAYLVVFISFTTKAVHLELASELSTPAFIAAYRRFSARRGNPSVIFSDNGTNFVGAHNYLRDLGRLLSAPQHQQSLCDAASSSGTDWRFIPPSSPHFGGLWEAAVKFAKHHLTRVIGEKNSLTRSFSPPALWLRHFSTLVLSISHRPTLLILRPSPPGIFWFSAPSLLLLITMSVPCL